ncbi:MAG: YybH family protein [Thermoguttaceae bacterium]
MRIAIALVVLAVAVVTQGAEQTAAIQDQNPLAAKIIQLERNALERWNNGDPSGYIEILSDDAVYFDPSLEKRLDGKKALIELFEPIRGKIHSDSYELLNPKVQAVKDMAVLTYNLVAVEKGKTYRWNCTEVYALENDGKWRIIQSHWSNPKPKKK